MLVIYILIITLSICQNFVCNINNLIIHRLTCNIILKMSSEKTDSEKETDNLASSSSTSSTIAAGLDALAHYISEKLHIDDVKSTPKVLSDTTIDGVVEYILSGNCKNIITMVGAGISTSAGIPDFRSPGSGLYDNLQKYDLPCPEAIFTLDYFHIDAKPFFALAKELYPGTFKPTLSHYFIKLLEMKKLLLRHYTQNIDTLERVADISSEKLVEAHGTFHVGHCLGCKKAYTQDWMKEKIFNDEIPTCTDCPGVVKPDIVFFGENLPIKFFKCTQQDFKKCDLLIIMGSSLAVQPFASLVYRVKSSCPRLLINREKAGELQFDSSKNVRDVLMLGDCDEQCQILADKLGWGDELTKLMKDEHARIEKEEKLAKETKKASTSKI